MLKPASPIQSDIDFAHQAALGQCGPECRDYHLTRPYVVASRFPYGPARDAEVFAPLLDELTPPGASVLIAGAADAGLMDFVLDAVGERSPRITVADRCQTPLLVSQRRAAQRGAEVAVVAADLSATPLGGAFDVIVAHMVLRFVAPAGRGAFLRGLSDALAPGGTIVVTQLGEGGGRRGTFDPKWLVAALARKDLVLRDPDKVIAAFQRLQDRRRTGARETPDLDALAAAAGLKIVRTDVFVPPALAEDVTDQSNRPHLYHILRRRSV